MVPIEAFAILPGRRSNQTQKRAAHGLETAEAAAPANGFEVVGRLFEPPARGLHPNRQDESSGGESDLTREDTGEIAR